MRSTKKVSINIVTWNSMTYLPHCMASIFRQDYHDFSVLIIDNGSQDGCLDFIKNNYPEVEILRNTHNLGYAKAHNQGIMLKQSQYLLIMNPDIILTPDYLSKIVNFADKNPQYSAIGGKILKFHFQADDLKEIVFTDNIDSIGIKPHRSRRFTNFGENEKDIGQYDQPREVFGVTGGLLLLRRDSLERIKILNEYFDEDFFVYKEDVDLSWRLRLYGLKCYYTPLAKAYHHRQAMAAKSEKIREVAKIRKLKSRIINEYSYRNHLFLLVKNEFVKNLYLNLPWIFWYEIKKFLYLLFFEPRTLKIYLDFIKKFSKMKHKRRIILNHNKDRIYEINAWFK